MMMTRAFLTNVANGVPLSIWYDWRDDGIDPREAEHHFGLVRPADGAARSAGFEPKPAFVAARTLTSMLKGFSFQERLDVGAADDYVLIFSRGGDRRIVAWTANGSRRLNIPNLAGEFTVTNMIGSSAGRISANRDALTVEVSATPVYLVPAR